MKKQYLILFFLLCSSILMAQQKCYQLVWSDEFNDTSLNSNVWNIEVNDNGGGNNELQYYTARPENIRLEDGNLVIEARKENYLTRNYTSGRITTQNKVFFKLGRIEARMKLPYGKGIWPAFWLLGQSISTISWPNCGEIDIMEMIGGGTNDSRVYTTLHWGPVTNGTHPSYGTSYTLPSGKFADDYHIFAIEWDENSIRGYCDNTQYYNIDISKAGLEAFHKNFFIIFNLAVGGNWPGNPDATTVFPQQMLVDYVRVYKKSSDFTIQGTTEAFEQDSVQFKVADFSDSLDYQWTIPASTTLIQNNVNSVLLKWGCNSDTVRLKIKSKCDSTIYTFPVKLKSPKIQGKQWVSEGATDLVYKVDSLPGSTIQWSSKDLIITGDPSRASVKVNAPNEGYLKVKITTSCNEYNDSMLIRFGDGQFPYPDANTPAKIPGTIIAANFDSGGEGVAYHDLDVGNRGNVYRLDENVDIEANDKSYTIGWFDNGEWVEYTVNVAKTDYYKAVFRVASQTGAGSFAIYFDNQLLADHLKVNATGAWSTFTNLTIDSLQLTAGTHILKIYSYGGFNLGNMTFSQCTGLANKVNDEIVLYPNPTASSNINLKIPSGLLPCTCKIYSVDGKVENSFIVRSSINSIDISNLSKGIYYLKLNSPKVGAKTFPLIVK
jgi:beta-glucanase (GH16 family)